MLRIHAFRYLKHIDINEKRSTHRRTFYDCAGFVSLSRVHYYYILFAVLLSSLFFSYILFTLHRKCTVFFSLASERLCIHIYVYVYIHVYVCMFGFYRHCCTYMYILHLYMCSCIRNRLRI